MATSHAEGEAGSTVAFTAIGEAVRLIWSNLDILPLGMLAVSVLQALPNLLTPVRVTRLVGRHGPLLSINPRPADVAASIALTLAMGIPFGLLTVGLQQLVLRRLRGETADLSGVLRLNGMGFAAAKWFLGFGIAQDLLITPLYWTAKNQMSPAGLPYSFWFYWIWFLVATGLVSVIGAPFMFTPLAIVDSRLSPIAAVQKSWHATRNLLPQLIVATIIVNIIAVSGLLACFVGVLVTGAVLVTFPVVLYTRLVDQACPVQPPNG